MIGYNNEGENLNYKFVNDNISGKYVKADAIEMLLFFIFNKKYI
jgi:hypothetical protein